MKTRKNVWAATALLLMMTACATNKPYQVALMPAPEVYTDGAVDPFGHIDHIAGESIPYKGMLYATNREPDSREDRFYKNERGDFLRLGLARITVGENELDWEEARRISLLKNRSDEYPLQLAHVQEFGILDRSVSDLHDPALVPPDVHGPAESFAELVNAKLKISKRKEILIYVHGYKVVFDNPVLAATELWHFLGYDGVAIAFAWPSTPKTLAYVSDLETAALSSHSLRTLIAFLAEQTDARRINIIGHSAGSRVVIGALHQLSLIHSAEDKTDLSRDMRIGQVILVGSDYDRDLFAIGLIDGLLKLPDRLTIYLSEADKALGISRWVFGRNRLGQMFQQRPLSAHVDAYLRQNETLVLIDVTNAEGATSGNGHAYFRSSPWVSSDVLISLHHRLRPSQRGLTLLPDLPVWSFPPDYNQRLQAMLTEIVGPNPQGPENKD